MAKGKATKVRKERRSTISASEFVKVYKPMAEAGKSAKEIGEALGRDSVFVLTRATALRKAIRKACEARKMTEEQTKAAMDSVPSLQGRGGRNVLKILGIVE